MVAGFVKLIPAFTLLINVTPSGPSFYYGPDNQQNFKEYSPLLADGSSYLVSERGYGATPINAKVAFGSNGITFDQNRKHARLDIKGIAKPDNQTNIYFALNGNVADCDDQVHQFFSSDPAFNGTDFGCGYVYATMSAPPGPYKYVEDLIFAGSQRYIGSPRGILGLEFKLSQMSV